jgi:hypothetical protein
MTFNSQICTTREQSERLIALGLKKETADCYYWQENDHIYGEATGVWHLETLDTEDTQEHFEYLDKYFGVCLADDEEHYFIPAWSLHRLIEMMPKNIAIDGDTAYPLQIQKRSDGKWCVGYQGWYDCVGDLYDSVIWIYQLLISEDYLDEFCNKG